MGSAITRLDWDSNFFGVSIARAEVVDLSVADAVDAAVGVGVQCLYLAIPNAYPPALGDAMRRGGRLVDLRLTFERESRVSPPAGVRDADASDLSALLPLARELSHSSRFRSDARFSPDAVGAMYETWVGRCLEDGIVVVPSGTTAAFVGARPDGDVLSVDLVYVGPHARGEGLAARLVRGALANAPHARARVATQAWNISAQRLYHGLGFRPSSLQAIVHLWLDTSAQPSDEAALETDTRS